MASIADRRQQALAAVDKLAKTDKDAALAVLRYIRLLEYLSPDKS